MSLQKMMQQAQKAQERLQKELSDLTVEIAVGGGMVEVRMSGTKELKAIKIDPEALDPEDPEMLQDLILSAINEANRRVDSEIQERVGSMLPGLSMPGLS